MRVIGVRIVEESGDADCSFTLRLVQIHVILISFTLPKWMQATASEWASLLQIEFSNYLLSSTYTQSPIHLKSKLFHSLPFFPYIFSYSSALHLPWNHPCISPFECIRACTCLSNHSLFLRKHCQSTARALQSTPHSLLLFRNHSISHNLTISISPSPHFFQYLWPSL